MKKLLFISLAVILALSVGLVGCAGGEEEEETPPAVWNTTIPLKMHCTIASAASICNRTYIPWAAAVNNLTGSQGGKFNITMTFGDIPFKAEQSLTQIAGGVVDIGQLSADTYNLGSLAYMPWMFPNITSVAYAMYQITSGASGSWDALHELDNVKILLSTPLHGAQWWSGLNVRDVRVPADISSPTKLKVRVESGFAETAIVQALGGTPTYIGTSDLTTAMGAGTVEGCFMTYTAIRPPFNFCPATAYVTELNMFYRAYALAMNKDSFDKLPAEAQTALMSLCGAQASCTYALAHIASEGGPFGYKTVTAQCHPITPLTPAELQLWKDATASVSTNWVAYMTAAGFNGAGILAKANELIPQTPK